jgi:F0F1-type ATP synthase membrane subunit b/b'
MDDGVSYGQLSEEDRDKVVELVEKAKQGIRDENIEAAKEARAKIEEIYKNAADKTNKEKTNIAGQLNNGADSPEQEAEKIRTVVDLVGKATTSVVGLTSAVNGL